jgi:hypothetical protein
MTSLASFWSNRHTALLACVLACTIFGGAAQAQAPAPVQIDQLNSHDVDNNGWGPPVAGPPAVPQPAVGPDTSVKVAHPLQGSAQTPGGHDCREFVMTMCTTWQRARFRPDGNFDAHPVSGGPKVAKAINAGTGGSIDVSAEAAGQTEITITGGHVTYVLHVHVVECPRLVRYHRVARGGATDWIIPPG